MTWIEPDYTRCTDEELLTEYDAITQEAIKRFGRRKLKKK